MNKYHIITLILCLFCLGGAATASPDRTAAAPDTQARSSQLKVSGIIKDDAGSPLIGVTIVVKGTSSGSVSNSDGSYTITVPYAEATLMVSYIGYAPQEIGVNNRTRIDITMVEDSKALEEVVVVGYNVQKKETITGSISTITTKDLKQSPTANINNALAGRMPGLLVNQFNGGEPGNDAAQLNIRGKSTYGKSDVIMIVDGIERDMSYLSPDEIETFTILKDASATAPYGIRGANGVIIVTTKRGRKGEKPTVDFKASVGVSEPIRYPDYLGSAGYATLYNEAMLNDNPSLDPGSASLFSQETISNFRRAKGDNSDGLGYNWDYFDYAFKPSILQDYSLSVRGGTDRARYFILGSYYNQGGNYKHSNSDNVNKFLRYNFCANVDVDATKRLKISVDLGARVTEYNYPGATAANIISLANTQPPYLPIILPNNHNDVNQADFEENGGYLLYADNDYRYNMLGQLNRTGFSKRTRRYLQGSFKLSHDLDFITKGLSVAAQFSYDTFNQHTINNSVPTHSTGNLTYPGYSTWMLPTEYSIEQRRLLDQERHLCNRQPAYHGRCAEQQHQPRLARRDVALPGAPGLRPQIRRPQRVGHAALLPAEQGHQQPGSLPLHGIFGPRNLRLPEQVPLRVQHRLQRLGELRPRKALRRIPGRCCRLGHHAGAIHEGRKVARPPQAARIVRSGG